MTVISSNAYLTVLDASDPLGDGIPNWWKIQYGLSLNDPALATNHPPGDQLTYLQKYQFGLNPLTIDTDGDGLSDYDEIFVYGTNPLNPNTAGDGIPDGWKVAHGMNPLIADANDEAGFDGVTYMQVYQYDLTHTNQLDPSNPFAVGSGLSNYEILNGGQHLNRQYYDKNDRLIGMESSKGISIVYQYDGNGNPLRQTVLSRSSETNGLPALWQFLNGLTNGTATDGAWGDADGDGWSNYAEWLAGTGAANENSLSGSSSGAVGTNIANVSLPFTPSNFVMAVGQLARFGSQQIVVGADGNPGTNTNSVFILTQNDVGWTSQQVSIGSFGITSIAIGKPSNSPSTNIYLGLRQAGVQGGILELRNTNGTWQSNWVAGPAGLGFVYGVRQTGDLLVGNGADGSLSSFFLPSTNGVWSSQILSTNSSHRGLGTDALVSSRVPLDASVRLLDMGGVEVIERAHGN